MARRAGLALVLAAVLCAAGPIGAEEPLPGEYQVKAAFLYNFVRFAEWPPEAFASPGAPLVVGIVGADPLEGAFQQTLRDKTVNGRRVQVRRVRSAAEARAVHVLFVGASEGLRGAGPLLESVRDAPILTVGERDGFAHTGGIINFVIDEGRVRFEINPDAAARARVRLSSRLLTLARIVR